MCALSYTTMSCYLNLDHFCSVCVAWHFQCVHTQTLTLGYHALGSYLVTSAMDMPDANKHLPV